MAEKSRVDGASPNCRICGSEIFTMIDLGNVPFANALVNRADEKVNVFPLALNICKKCSTAQLSYCADERELYKNYLFITPQSNALSDHYEWITKYLEERNYLSSETKVLEIGSNIGRFLEHIQPRVKSILGVDPAINIAEMANRRDVPTVNAFFNAGEAAVLRDQFGVMDLFIARHCFAHNEKPWQMLDGVIAMMHPDSVLLIENAYFLDTIQKYEFDQIYHEHMYYHTVRSISEIVSKRGLQLVDVIHSDIHGGTMLYVIKKEKKRVRPSKSVNSFLRAEKNMHDEDFYKNFQEQIERNKGELMSLLNKLISRGKTIYGYGASAKSTTLVNYYGITNGIVPIVLDSTVTKQGKYIPLANIRVVNEQEYLDDPPDYYLLTIWNYKKEIIQKVRDAGNHHTKFILPHPEVEIYD